MRKLLLIATAAAVLAACGETQRSSDTQAASPPEPPVHDSAQPEAESRTDDRQIARSVETEPGEWHYKTSNGYPWAGFGPPASEAMFTISCQRGQIIFGHAIELDGDEADMTVSAGSETQTIKLADLNSELPMAEGGLPANSVFIDALLNTEQAFSVTIDARSFDLRPAPEYRQVIRECRSA